MARGNSTTSLTHSRESAAGYAARVRTELGSTWLPNIYRERVRTARTRAYSFEAFPPKARVEIQHTLLGIELKLGRRRLLCPDLATARYLSIFARAGCTHVAVPYDITKLSQLADEIESSWHRMLLLVGHLAANKSDVFRARVTQLLMTSIREEIAAAGAGEVMPQFKQSTRQQR